MWLGQYRVVGPLCHGGMGTVYEAFDERLHDDARAGNCTPCGLSRTARLPCLTYGCD